MKLNKRIASILFGGLLSLGLALPVYAQRSTDAFDPGLPQISVPQRKFDPGVHVDAQDAPVTIMPRGGSFGGGGGRSFGGGGGFGGSSRGFGGGGFGGGSGVRSSGGGSFGGGSNRGFGGTASPRTSQGGSSFGQRSGAMGMSGSTHGTNISAPRGYASTYYGGRSVFYEPGGYWGGYSYGWWHPAWYYYTPFHPAFYFSPPYMDPMTGYYHPGGFSFSRLIGGLCCCPLIVIGIVWLIAKGGGKRVKYTTYR